MPTGKSQDIRQKLSGDRVGYHQDLIFELKIMLITVNPESLSLSPGSEIILRNQSWQDYKDLLAIRKDKKLPKLYFNAQNQEIHLMSPLPSHVNRIDTLRDLVKSEIPPLLAIEIVSPDSIQRDYRYKRSEYAAVGIAEYWIVDALE